MSTSTAATHVIPAALITHTVASLRGPQQADISVHHARTTDARICVTFSGILMVIYSCHAAQGLLEAFTAARGHLARVPREIPAPRTDPDDTVARTTLSIEWTRAPQYAVAAQSAVNKQGNQVIHWAELYTGPITWRIRDQIGLLTTIETLTTVHHTAIAVFLDADRYGADPTDTGYPGA